MFRHLDLETHNICNRRCSYCPVVLEARGDDEYLPLPVIDRVAQELGTAKYDGRINLNLYNEPLLDERFDEIVQIIRRRAPYSHIHTYTNGDYLTASRARALVKIGVGSIKITDHNPKPNRRLLNMMRELKDLKQVELHRFNQDSPLHNRGGSLDHEWTKSPSATCWPSKGDRCYIDFKGNVLVCCDDAFATTTMGNIKSDSLLAIWNSARFRKFREGLRKRDYYFDICAKCNVNAGRKVKLKKL